MVHIATLAVRHSKDTHAKPILNSFPHYSSCHSCLDSPDLPRLFPILLRFLDYPHNATETDGWTLLDTLQRLW